jgi:hypothetical protein
VLTILRLSARRRGNSALNDDGVVSIRNRSRSGPAVQPMQLRVAAHTLIQQQRIGGIAIMDVINPVDLTGSFTTELHDELRKAAKERPLATDIVTGATVVLCQDDVEALAHDQRLNGIGLTLFDMMGITDGPLRDWYSRLMFTTEGDYHRRIRSLVSRGLDPGLPRRDP